MAAFPVTASQFRAFVQASDGYSSNRWWDGLEREQAGPEWERMLPNHPVTFVSWYDATAFCRWLGASLAMEVRLPDEQEWQSAAQSENTTFAYPWGKDWEDGRANTDESGISHTTAVGMFPGATASRESRIWRATYGSGAAIATSIRIPRRWIRRRKLIGPSLVCCAVALGSSFGSTRARTPASTTIRSIATTTLVFGWWFRLPSGNADL